jgi:hypothetical protein
VESEKWWNIGVGEMVEHSNVGVGEGTLESEKWWNIATLESEKWWNIATISFLLIRIISHYITFSSLPFKNEYSVNDYAIIHHFYCNYRHDYVPPFLRLQCSFSNFEEMVEHSNVGVGERTLESGKWWNIATLELIKISVYLHICFTVHHFYIVSFTLPSFVSFFQVNGLSL